MPDLQTVGVLLQEGDLPVVVAQRGDVAVVGPIEEFLARPFAFALEGGHQIVAVEVDLEGRVADLLPFSKSSLTVVSPAAAISVGSMSSCAPMSLMIVPGLMTPGQRIRHGTR